MRPVSLMALIALGVALAASPHSASAQSVAYSVPGSTNVRAGPGTQYPVVARVRGGVEILVYGCLSDRAWCDVQVYETRGWMSSRRLEFVYGGSRVLVPEYYAYFGAPFISFDFGYWDRYYEDRPFYRRWRRHNRPPRFEEPPMGDPLPPGPPQYNAPNPPGDGAYQNPPPDYQQPPSGGYEPPVLGGGPGDQPPSGGPQPPVIGGGGFGDQVPGGAGLCPPGVVCP
jgi:uncharacterized protein YraI